MDLTLSLTAHNRPDYLAEVLASWHEVDGVDEITAVFNVEPGNEEVRELCEKADFFRENVTIVNPHRFGALTNPWYALCRGFRYSDFVIVGEDDSVVSTDVLRFFDFCRGVMEEHPKVFAAAAFRWRYPNQLGPDESEQLVCDAVSLGGFAPTIWGTTVLSWRERIRDTWDFTYQYQGWDWNFQQRIAPGNQCLVPWVSRSQHIGQFGGVHCLPEQFEEFRSDCFVADPSPGGFRLV
jgi:hypothetical protein